MNELVARLPSADRTRAFRSNTAVYIATRRKDFLLKIFPTNFKNPSVSFRHYATIHRRTQTSSLYTSHSQRQISRAIGTYSRPQGGPSLTLSQASVFFEPRARAAARQRGSEKEGIRRHERRRRRRGGSLSFSLSGCAPRRGWPTQFSDRRPPRTRKRLHLYSHVHMSNIYVRPEVRPFHHIHRRHRYS